MRPFRKIVLWIGSNLKEDFWKRRLFTEDRISIVVKLWDCSDLESYGSGRRRRYMYSFLSAPHRLQTLSTTGLRTSHIRHVPEKSSRVTSYSQSTLQDDVSARHVPPPSPPSPQSRIRSTVIFQFGPTG